jgi:signal transduction histidine kinase
MPEGGIIRVSLDSREAATDGHVLLSIADSGGGINPALIERIFDPFFTTKPRDRGTGLGLTVVQQAVERAGGRIRVENRPGQGATFIVELPRVSGS